MVKLDLGEDLLKFAVSLLTVLTDVLPRPGRNFLFIHIMFSEEEQELTGLVSSSWQQQQQEKNKNEKVKPCCHDSSRPNPVGLFTVSSRILLPPIFVLANCFPKWVLQRT